MSQASEVSNSSIVHLISVTSVRGALRKCKYGVCTQEVQVQSVHSESAGTECALRKCRYREGGFLVPNFPLLQLFVAGNVHKRGPVVCVVSFRDYPVWTLQHDLVYSTVHDLVSDLFG